MSASFVAMDLEYHSETIRRLSTVLITFPTEGPTPANHHPVDTPIILNGYIRSRPISVTNYLSAFALCCIGDSVHICTRSTLL